MGQSKKNEKRIFDLTYDKFKTLKNTTLKF